LQVPEDAQRIPIGTKHLVSLKASARALVNSHAGRRVNGAVASIRTRQLTLDVVHSACERLWAMGYQLRDIRQLSRTHVQALVRHWMANGYSLKTIQNHISRLRRVAEWIGKPEMITHRFLQQLYPHLPADALSVKVDATRSKSWSERGIDVVAKILQADALDLRFGAMLRLGVTFGLRRKEQLRARPHLMDAGTLLLIRQNMAKSGKDRDVPIEHPFQRVCLEHAKRLCQSRDDFLGWPERSYEQNVERYKYLMKKIGITGRDSDCVGHGLRAEYAENIALLHGLVPPVLGGRISQIDGASRLQIQNIVSRNMGHHRPEVTRAYYGQFRKEPDSGCGG